MQVNSVPEQPLQPLVNGSAFFDLSRVTAAGKALRERLHYTTPSYMKQPIQDGFNWSEALEGIAPGEFYLVVFRSQHSAEVDPQLIWEHDQRAHEVARATPGYVFYFAGVPAEDRACMSFCLWANRGQARLASNHEAHMAAVQLAFSMYETFQLERYIVRNTADGVVQFTALHDSFQVG